MKVQHYILSLFITLFLISNLTFSQNDDFFEPKTTIGGYGELHYNYKKVEDNEATKTLDFHRFVTFISHSWSEKWSLKAEIELEHNFVKDGQGELELEQAYVDYRHAEWLGVQAGVILPSAGLINEFHEPPLFLGVERPEYNNKIIPTTWFGNGAAIYGYHKGFDYKFVVMEGFNADKFSASGGIRGGRQKGYKANAENLLYNARLDYVGQPGLKIGASFTYNEAMGDSLDIPINLIEVHAQYRANNIYADFEYGNISYDEGEVENSMGYYVDFGYNIGSLLKIESEIVPFVRFSNYNTAASTKSGGDSEKQYDISKWMIGLFFNPIDEVVFKADYSENTVDLNDETTKLFNLGVGYMF